MGATVEVDTETGSMKVLGKFKWPIDDADECRILASPTVAFDRNTDLLYLDFFSDFGKFVILNVKQAKVVGTIKPKNIFFVGYTNFYDVTGSSTYLNGLQVRFLFACFVCSNSLLTANSN